LFAPEGSRVEDETKPPLFTTPARVVLTVILTVATARLASAPKLHVTVVVPEQAPWLAVADRNERAGGRTSVATTLDARSGPAFAIRSV